MSLDFASAGTNGPVCVCGSLNMDLVAYQSDVPSPGGYSHGHQFEMGLGGKGFNVAVSIAATGVETYLVGRVGKDLFGGLMQRKLGKTAVRSEFVRVDPTIGTGVGHVRVNANGDYDTCVVAGANAAMNESDVDEALTSGVGFTHLVLEFEIPLPTALYAARRARALGISVVLNASPASPGASQLLPYTDVLVVNESEAHALWAEVENSDAQWPTKLWDVIDRLRKVHGSRDVVVTLGSNGVWGMSSRGEMRQLAGHDVTVVNAVGAGDSFLAMLVSSMSRGNAMLASLEQANAAGALACSRAESWLDSKDGPRLAELIEDRSVVINPRARKAGR